MSFSVTIAAYQAEGTIRSAVESARAQELRPDEVIVVDDGSTDRTAAVAQEAGARVIRLGENGGAAAARNVALDAAAGDWVAFLDADDTWTAEHLTRLAQAIGAVPTAVAAFGGMVKVRPRGETFSIPIPFDPHTSLDAYGTLLRRNRVPMSASAVRRDLSVRLGGFDETIRVVFDYDFWLRVARHGPLVHARGATVRYPVHSNQLSANYFRLLEESWQVRLRSWSGLDAAARERHGGDVAVALELDLRRSWTRRRADELDFLLAMADRVPGGEGIRAAWLARRRILPWVKLPLLAYDILPRSFRTRLAKLRGRYDYDLAQ